MGVGPAVVTIGTRSKELRALLVENPLTRLHRPPPDHVIDSLVISLNTQCLRGHAEPGLRTGETLRNQHDLLRVELRSRTNHP